MRRLLDPILLPDSSYFRKIRYKRIKNKVKDILPKLVDYVSQQPGCNTLNEQIDFIVDNLLEITKSQGAYISTGDFDENDLLKGLRVVSLKFNQNMKDNRIFNHNTKSALGAYFPMKPEMLHFMSMNSGKLLICNDKNYLKKHQCPGVIIENIMYIPIFVNVTKNIEKPVALLCLINTSYKYGFQVNMAKDIGPILNLLAILIKSDRTAKKMIENDRLYFSENEQSIKDMSSFIIRNSKEMAAIFTSDGKLMVASTVFDEGISLLAEGKKNKFIDIDDLKVTENTMEIYNNLIAMKSGNPSFLRVMQTFKTPSGILYFDSTYGSIYGENEHIIGTYIMAKNITNNKVLEDKLRSTSESLEHALKEKDIYMSRISHELRTPLNSIFGFSQLIDLSIKNNEEVDPEWSRTILKSSEHLLRLVNEVLDLSKVGSGNIKLSLEEVSIVDVLNEVVHLLISDAKNMNLSIKLESQTCHDKIFVDKHRMNQVITNVISNAIKYNKKNGKIDIKIEPKTTDKISILIIDSGIGIDENRIQNIGTPFDRLGMEDSNIEGSGLGLALSISLLKQMDCSFNVTSKKNIGTTIELICPATQPVIGSQNYLNNPNIKYSSVGKTFNSIEFNDSIDKLKNVILYIVDNVTNYKLMETIVEKRMKLKIIVANQGRRGIDIAKSIKPNLIILDLGLPDISGIEVLYELKSHPATSNIPVIIFSADANPTTVRNAINMGASKYLTKPTRIEDIEKEINKHLKINKKTN